MEDKKDQENQDEGSKGGQAGMGESDVNQDQTSQQGSNYDSSETEEEDSRLP